MHSTKPIPRALLVVLLASAALFGCHRERKKMISECGLPTDSSERLSTCLDLAEKHGGEENGSTLDIAWSGVQFYCSYEEELDSRRQKECDRACVRMKTSSDVHGNMPSGVGGSRYKRTALASGTCEETGSSSTGGGGGTTVRAAE